MSNLIFGYWTYLIWQKQGFSLCLPTDPLFVFLTLQSNPLSNALEMPGAVNTNERSLFLVRLLVVGTFVINVKKKTLLGALAEVDPLIV